MQISSLAIHNFRGILDCGISTKKYCLIIGPNNGGKSTVIDAIRCFYEKDDYKFKSDRDFPFITTKDKESWIEIEFKLSDDEYSSLKEEYKLPNNTLKVRKYFASSEKGADGKAITNCIFSFTNDGKISTEQFYGAKNVQSGKFGDLIYIPAVSKVDDHAKLSGPSALRDLVTDVLQSVVESSKSFQKFTDDFNSFAGTIKSELSDDGRSLSGLETELNALLGTWSAEFQLKMSPPSTTEIIKSLISYEFLDKAHGESLGASQFGSGFQRHFIYSLIQIASKYAAKKVAKKTKDFSPVMTLILFEEPEAFLHPPQQDVLSRSLMDLAGASDRQVICSSHSAQFVSKNANDLPSIVRVKRVAGLVKTYQINSDDWNEVVVSNQKINEIASRWPKMKAKLEEDDTRSEMEAIKYFLWLNPDRSCMFFADYVLLVEGVTEQAFVNKLLGDKKIKDNERGLYVLDCLGKYNIHRFVILLSKLGIEHSVLHDDDLHRDEHKELNQLVVAAKDEVFTKFIKQIPNHLENFLDVPMTKAHRKPQHLLLLLEEGKIKSEKLKGFTELVEGILPGPI